MGSLVEGVTGQDGSRGSRHGLTLPPAWHMELVSSGTSYTFSQGPRSRVILTHCGGTWHSLPGVLIIWGPHCPGSLLSEVPMVQGSCCLESLMFRVPAAWHPHRH